MDVESVQTAQAQETNYDHLSFSREDLRSVMHATYQELLEFVSQPAFIVAYKEMMELPPTERPAYVQRVFLSAEEMQARGIVAPEGVLVQTSAFGDRRPTLFVLKKYLPVRFHDAWENVNLTFFNEFDDDEVPRDPDLAWRPPLPVALQQALLSHGIDLNSLPPEIGVNYDRFERSNE